VLTAAVVLAYVAWCGLLIALGLIPDEFLPDGNSVMVLDADLVAFLAVSALIEELIFRAPLVAAVRILRRPALIAVCVVALSCMFGYMHHGKIYSVPIQGMFGLLISVMFLKCGGANGKFLKPLLCTTFAHCMNNVFLCLVADLVAGSAG